MDYITSCFLATELATISKHPVSLFLYKNETATLSCMATASGIIRYQWRRVNGEITSDRANGVNTSTLTISSVTEQDEDEYYCVASYGIVNGTLHNTTSHKAKVVLYSKIFSLFSNVDICMYSTVHGMYACMYVVHAHNSWMSNIIKTHDSESRGQEEAGRT